MTKKLTTIMAALLAFAVYGPRPARANDNATESQTQRHTMRVDVNSASKEELMTLPGVNDSEAQKIIDHRPYRRKGDLLKKKVLPRKTYFRIRSRVIAHGGQEIKSGETRQQGNEPSNGGMTAPSEQNPQTAPEQAPSQTPSQQNQNNPTGY